MAAAWSGLEWPEAATGVLVTGTPIGAASDGSAEGRDQAAVCDETSQITMGFLFAGKMFRAYGVRSAVTRRASRIVDFEPAARRQDASKFGHERQRQGHHAVIRLLPPS